MGKLMARINNGVVINLEWTNDDAVDTDELKNVYDLQINVGDTYENNKFYRNGTEVVTFRKQIQNMLSDYDTALTEIASYIPSTMKVSNTDSFIIDDRKQIILDYLREVVSVLETNNANNERGV